jgi:hypothetical protein
MIESKQHACASSKPTITMRPTLFFATILWTLVTAVSLPQAQAGHSLDWPYSSIHIELRDKLSTRRVEGDETFDAKLTRDLYKGDFLIAPAGSKLRGRVVDAQGGQRKPQRQRAELEITLTEIEIEGEWVPLHSNTLTFKSKRNYSAVKVGSGIALGALVAGFKGAAIGGLTGVGWAVLTNDKHIKLKKGVELEFSLRQGGRLKRQVKEA